MPQNISESQSPAPAEAHALSQAPVDGHSAKGKTTTGRTVSPNPHEKHLPVAAKATDRARASDSEPLSRFSVSTLPPKLTYNHEATGSSEPVSKGPYQAKVSNKFFNHAVKKLNHKGYNKQEAFHMLQEGLRQPEASHDSIKQLVESAPFKNPSEQKTHREVAEQFANPGFEEPKAQELAPGIVTDLRHTQDQPSPPPLNQSPVKIKQRATQAKPGIERPMTKETYVKRSLLPKMRKKLERQGFERQEARAMIKHIIKSLGGPAACNIEDVKIIVKMIPSKLDTVTGENSTRNKALDVLGLSESATLDNILEAYHKLLPPRG